MDQKRSEKCYEIARQVLFRMSHDMDLDNGEVAGIIAGMVMIFDDFLTEKAPGDVKTWRKAIASALELNRPQEGAAKTGKT